MHKHKLTVRNTHNSLRAGSSQCYFKHNYSEYSLIRHNLFSKNMVDQKVWQINWIYVHWYLYIILVLGNGGGLTRIHCMSHILTWIYTVMSTSTHMATSNHSSMPTCILDHTHSHSATSTHTQPRPHTFSHTHTSSLTSLMFPTFLWTSQWWGSSPLVFSSTVSSPWWSVSSSLQEPNTRQHNMLSKDKMYRL